MIPAPATRRELVSPGRVQRMSSTISPLPEGVILLAPGEGRHYPCGPMQSVFLADGQETGDRYSVSIWWVAPGKPGPGAHSHAGNEELFYVIEGTMAFLVGDRHVDAVAGTFLRIPAGVVHDFENRTTQRAGALNVFIPGGFEANMPSIVQWFANADTEQT
jgi:mannose-6-phosphate isomerase-like protein (cupin superfamily)